MPQISVIVPVYKVEPYLRRCVDSILAQTFTDFELILVDDGSPDNCPAICDEYAAQDERVHVIHQQNGGLSAARNAGLDWVFQNSDSAWISFVDSDDWVHSEYLERLLDAIEETDTAISICRYVETTRDEPENHVDRQIIKLWTPEDFYVKNMINATIACGKLYRKECFDTVRYPVNKLHEDEFTTYKLLFAQKRIAVTSSVLYYYFVNYSGITKSSWSPNKLVSIEAKEQQIAFFHDNGYLVAYERAISALFWNISTHIHSIEAEPRSAYSSWVKKLRRLLRRKLKRYKSVLSLSVHKDYAIYEVAYPRLMKYYWLWQVVLKKLKWKK